MPTEAAIETELQAKGKNAPRLTPAMIDACIVSEQYHVFPGTTLTVCALTLRNGFVVTGESAAASPENFDAGIGAKIARDNARQKIWALEGYRLREAIHQGQKRGRRVEIVTAGMELPPGCIVSLDGSLVLMPEGA